MQLRLFPSRMHLELTRNEHGGTVRQGRRKLARPVSTRRPMHVVLSGERARGPWSVRRHERAVKEALRAMARRHGVRVYEFANVGTHLHLLLRVRRIEAFRAFLRSLPGWWLAG
jgi:hypothetical protein